MNVKSHFIVVNQLTKAIDTAFKDKDIVWIENDTLIDCDNNLKLNF